MAFDPDLCNLYAFAKEGCDDETEHVLMREHARNVKSKMGLDDDGGERNMAGLGDFDIMSLLMGDEGGAKTAGGVGAAYFEDKIVEMLEPKLGESMGAYASSASLILVGVAARLLTKKTGGDIKNAAEGFAFVATCSGYSDLIKGIQ